MTTDPGAPRTDELARNVALHAIADPILSALDGTGLTEDDDAARLLARSAVDQHTVTWETDVNSAGVPVRRYVMRGAWEVDPAPPRVPAHDELLHSVAETYGPHPFVRQSYKGRQIDVCAHFTRTSSHEASTCGAGKDDPIHAV